MFWLSISRWMLQSNRVPEDPRPNPDAILAAIHAEESKDRRGRLKVFFGMSPGVGKTYSMLQAARRRKADGDEVVVGTVETHGRTETTALLSDLPLAPLAEVSYRGAKLK